MTRIMQCVLICVWLFKQCLQDSSVAIVILHCCIEFHCVSHYTTIYLSILLLMDTWVVSKFQAIMTKAALNTLVRVFW